jgi:hypothetical protein
MRNGSRPSIRALVGVEKISLDCPFNRAFFSYSQSLMIKKLRKAQIKIKRNV